MKYVYWTPLPQLRKQGMSGNSGVLSTKTIIWWRHHSRPGWLPLSFSEIILAAALQKAGLSPVNQSICQTVYSSNSSNSRAVELGLPGANPNPRISTESCFIKKTGGNSRRRHPD